MRLARCRYRAAAGRRAGGRIAARRSDRPPLGRWGSHSVLHVQRFFDCFRIPGDGPKESIRRYIRLRATLLPVSKRCQIEAIPYGERLPGELRAIPDFANTYRPRRMNLRDHACGRQFILQCQ